jgi:hypothetical protein
MAADPQRTALSDHVKVLCGHCGATIWHYPTPTGKSVALDDGVGPYVVVGMKAYEGGPTDGYRGHLDHCKAYQEWRLGSRVSSDEFLWP